MFALTYIKGEQVAGWVRDFGKFLDTLDPVYDDGPIIWDHFLNAFQERFQDLTKENWARNELEKLQLKLPLIDEYTSKFEELAWQAGYLAGNPETCQLFLYSLLWNILEEVMRGGVPPTYQDLKQWAVEAVQSKQMIDNIVRWREHLPQNPFQNANWPCPFYFGPNCYDDQRGQGHPQQRQWNSSNAPWQMNNAPVPMDINRAQANCPRGNRGYQGYQGCVATLNEPGGSWSYWPPNRAPVAGPRGACFECSQMGHFTRNCPRKKRQANINLLDFEEDNLIVECTSKRNGDRWGFSHCLVRLALIRQSNSGDVYLSMRKSMTLQFFIHSIAKRAEATALVNFGAIKNFMNLTYVNWLWLPIKQMDEPRKLLNVDRMENKSGELKYYTDLQVQTGTNYTNLHFYLTELREQKAILGYPWFAAAQPKIDWKWGWIDHTQLPVILHAHNAKRANFIPQQRNIPRKRGPNHYFIGWVVFYPKAIPAKPIGGIPSEYQQHKKVFSEEESQWLPHHTIWDHTIELLLGAPTSLPGWLLPLTQSEIAKAQKFIAEHLKRGMICESWSPYATNFFFVKRKDGKLCPVQDYHPINKWTKRNHNVSPLIPQTIDCLSGCTLFTKFDIQWEYNNICIKPGDEWKAAFLTPEGLFEPTVMFFSLTNSPATF